MDLECNFSLALALMVDLPKKSETAAQYSLSGNHEGKESAFTASVVLIS